MGLNSEISADIANAFDTDLNDAVKYFDGEHKDGRIDGLGDWLGDDDKTRTSYYDGRGVFGGFNAHEVDGNSILATDTRLICLQTEVSDTPAVDDVIINDDNKYRIIAINKDPADVSYTIQLRAI
ncbi:glutamate 5-kinase [Moraxella nasovis]|uniref:glutamate 5-kinase n=1 Tax=Moraxella nasovis TaxID=2904121 RepID=UPI001F60BEE9|nr:glutamate 5-kinase [Moraxella nasovis]UNU74111.1 glutamate 5-kinase [Moraxella nasovis]